MSREYECYEFEVEEGYLLEDDPPGALDIIAILVGQRDGKVEISANLLITIRRDFLIEVIKNLTLDSYTIRLVPKNV